MSEQTKKQPPGKLFRLQTMMMMIRKGFGISFFLFQLLNRHNNNNNLDSTLLRDSLLPKIRQILLPTPLHANSHVPTTITRYNISANNNNTTTDDGTGMLFVAN